MANILITPPMRLTPRHLILLREHFALAQGQAAELAGVTRVTWNRWENGQQDIPLYMTHALRGLTMDLKKQYEREELGL